MTFFRSMGGRSATALFGAVLNTRLGHYLEQAFAGAPGAGSQVSADRWPTSRRSRALPPEIKAPVLESFVRSPCTTCSSPAIPFVVVAFLVAFLIPEVPLRTRQQPAVGGRRRMASPPMASPDGEPTDGEPTRRARGWRASAAPGLRVGRASATGAVSAYAYTASVTLTVSIAGASGYAGGELLRLVSGHPELHLGALAAGNRAGRPVTDVHPQLVGLAGRTFVPTDADSLAEADLVFLALPHGESAALVAALPTGLPVVDLGADFRLVDTGAWDRYYGSTPHAGAWPYGLPELPDQRARLAGAARVANPGCYATAVALALAPLLAASLVEPADLVVVAASGTSGRGSKGCRVAAGQRGHGLHEPLQGRRRAPAHP